jgi:SagB-type dehydrogenase family enzyme
MGPPETANPRDDLGGDSPRGVSSDYHRNDIVGAHVYLGKLERRQLSNYDREAARLYHEFTKHSYTSVRSNPHALDWENRPLAYKIYPAAGSVALPRELDLSSIPATAAIAGRIESATGDSQAPTTFDALHLDLDALTRILFCAGGLTRSKSVGGEDYHFRAAASAGALYPIEIYLAARDVEALEPGLYHFSPADLKLRGLRRGGWCEYLAQAAPNHPALVEASAVLLLSAVFWRSAWKYRARAYRYCFWDAGTILANLLAAANAEGLPVEIITAFEDPLIERLIDVDGEHEGIVCLVALGRTRSTHKSSVDSPTMAGATSLAPLELDTVPLSAHETVYEDLAKIHRASRLESSDEVRALSIVHFQREGAPVVAESVRPVVLPPNEAMGLGETILRRGSTRTFARESIPAGDLATIMETSKAPLHTDFPALVDAYLIVNSVDDLPSGAYFYRREYGSFDLLKVGDFRREAGYLCLEQPLGADCSALICYMTDLDRIIDALANRGYRDAHLEAGILGGRAYLAAYALGRGATGLTFYDDDTTKFFSPHAAGKSPLLMVAIGVPSRPLAVGGESI